MRINFCKINRFQVALEKVCVAVCWVYETVIEILP